MVKQGQKAFLHVNIDPVRFPQDIKGEAAAQNPQYEPPFGHPRHEAHTGKYEDEHQRAAHIPGHHGVHPRNKAQMPHQHRHGRNGLEISRFLQVGKLPGQQDDKGQLHDLRRLHIHRKARNAQPRPVAAVFNAQGRFQQQKQHQTAAQQPFPMLAQLIQIQHTHEYIGNDAQAQSRSLNDHIFI